MRGGKRAGAGRKPGTTTKAKVELMALARVYTPEALSTLVNVMKASDSDAARVSAAKELLDRGHGRAPQPQTGEGGEGPIKLELSWLQPSA